MPRRERRAAATTHWLLCLLLVLAPLSGWLQASAAGLSNSKQRSPPSDEDQGQRKAEGFQRHGDGLSDNRRSGNQSIARTVSAMGARNRRPCEMTVQDQRA
jgi:hypothetical protein